MHTGDLAIVRREDTYSVGDVIAFKVNGGFVIHRIYSVTASGGFTTKGDNNPGTDPWEIRPDQVAGKLWLFVPDVGRLIAGLRDPIRLGLLAAGLTLLALLPVLDNPENRKSNNGQMPQV